MTLDLTTFEVLSFDCYGTLIDWEAGIAEVLGPRARRHDGSPADEDLLAEYAGHEAAVEAENPRMPYPDVLREAFRRTGAGLGFDVAEADADALAASVPDWPAFPDSAEALARLKRRYRLVILSNVDRRSFAGSNLRLGVEFDGILTAQDIGSYKPDPANFAALLRRIDEMGARGRLLHVAQSLFHDHVPAKAAGLPTVWIDRRHARPGWGATPEPRASVSPDLTFPSLAAFADAVDAAFAAAGADADHEVSVRSARAEDAAEIARVIVRSWRETYRGVVPDRVLDDPGLLPARERFWNAVFTEERGRANRIAVAERDGSVIGAAMAGPVEDEGQGWAFQLYVLYVVAEELGSGAGPALLDAVLEPDAAAALWVADPNPRAQAFYRKHGFEADGTTQVDDGVREIRMVRIPRPHDAEADRAR